MALLPEIVDRSEIETYLSVTTSITEEERGLLEMIHRQTEYMVRKFCNHGITQATYTEYYPTDDLSPTTRRTLMEYRSGRVFTIPDVGEPPRSIFLNNIFVSSITSVYEDFAAYADQGPSDFPASSELTAGTDFYLVLDKSGLSRSGELRRIGTTWSTRPGTIKVTYVAGLTAAQLDDDYLDLKLAVLQEIAQQFKIARSRAGTGTDGVGVIQSKKVAGIISTQYEVTSLRDIFTHSIAQTTQERLSPYVRMSV